MMGKGREGELADKRSKVNVELELDEKEMDERTESIAVSFSKAWSLLGC